MPRPGDPLAHLLGQCMPIVIGIARVQQAVQFVIEVEMSQGIFETISSLGHDVRFVYVFG